MAEKPSLRDEWAKSGDIRVLYHLIENYDYTDEEVSEVINYYEPYENDYIPEVEHIHVLLLYFPTSKISENTMNAIKKCYPDFIKDIEIIQKRALKYKSSAKK